MDARQADQDQSGSKSKKRPHNDLDGDAARENKMVQLPGTAAKPVSKESSDTGTAVLETNHVDEIAQGTSTSGTSMMH